MARTRISPRVMNNVVIFAMLFMILLFNLDAFLPEPAAPQARPLISENDYLLKVEQSPYSLERAGQSWRQTQLNTALSVTPETQLAAWQQGQLAPADAVPDDIATAQPYVAVVWLAGNSQGQVFAFYPDQQRTFVKTQNQWFILKDTALPTLLPWNEYN